MRVGSFLAFFLLFLSAWVCSSCTTLPAPSHRSYLFPKGAAFIEDIKVPYQVLGTVRAKVEFATLDVRFEETDLCRNYYNKAVQQLVEYSREKGGTAVIHVKSVVFLQDGRQEVYSTPECSDDGMEGQILVQGVAVVLQASKNQE